MNSIYSWFYWQAHLVKSVTVPAGGGGPWRGFNPGGPVNPNMPDRTDPPLEAREVNACLYVALVMLRSG